MKRLAVVILNYRTAELTIECLRTLAAEVSPHDDRCAVVVDQNSGDGSADAIAQAIDRNQWGGWLTLIRSPDNLGFAGGNNLGMRSVEAKNYLLFNSDARATPGGDAIGSMLDAMDSHPDVGAVCPRLQDPDGTPQISCFRYRTPLTEFLDAAGTGVLDRLFSKRLVPMGVFNEPMQPQWGSFACMMLRREVIERVGYMDDRYFMYFEDIDYARRMNKAGFRMLHWPAAKVVHLRGGSSSVKSAMKARKRVPKYYYQARSRYYAKFYGGAVGLWMTNFLWLLGRSIAWTRETFGRKTPDVCERQARDNWTNWLMPMRPHNVNRPGETTP